MPLATESTWLVPHPVEIAALVVLTLAVVTFILVTALLLVGKIRLVPTFVVALPLTLFLPLLGPVIALVLVVRDVRGQAPSSRPNSARMRRAHAGSSPYR